MSDIIITRKGVLQRFIVLPALAAGLVAAGTTAAQAKASKADYQYQDKPNGKNKCSGCAFFIPGKDDSSPGTCKLVEGDISPNGWCIAYNAKS